MLDYLFKSSAADVYVGGAPLVQFFSWYYGLSAVAVIAVQMLATAAVLERAGVARAVMTSPAAVIAGAAGTLLAPGLAAITVTRAMESVLRGSLFRSAYEIFFTPVAAADKRAAKSVIDVGFDRLGEAAGAVFVIAVFTVSSPEWQESVLLVAAIAASAGALVVATWLTKGYIAALEGRLREQALALSLTEVRDLTTRAVLQRTLITAPGMPVLSRAAPAGRDPRAAGAVRAMPWDTDTLQILAIRSGRPERITRVLHGNRLSPALVPHAIALLEDPRFSTEAATALAHVAAEHIGGLIDVMLDEQRPSTVRRRVARLLGGVPRRRAVNGLLDALGDADFSLRVASGDSLANIRTSNPEVQLDPALLYAAVLRELSLGRAAWDRHRVLPGADAQDARAFPDEFVRHRAHQGLAHVFLLLSLVLPSEPLRIAYRGLHTDDRVLRGTALEYLDSVLPADVRDALWPYIAAEEPPRALPAARAEALTRLLASHSGILKNLTNP
jgi:AAA family ATP:ADP antiporter